MWYWDIEETKNKIRNRQRRSPTWNYFIAMPTLLEALEQKYGFAETSDKEAEPELLILRLPKRNPRQR